MAAMPRLPLALAPLSVLAVLWTGAGCAAAPDAPTAAAPAPATGTTQAGSPLPERAFELQARGLAALENEQPVEAEAVYRELAAVAPADGLPWANLAVAQLRQQKTDEALASIGEALARVETGTEGAGAVHAVHGAILDWVGRPEEALAAYRAAAAAAPDDPETLYSLYRLAETLERPDEAQAALDRLATLRPDHFVLLVERGKRAIAAGDRAAATAVYLRIRELLWQAPPIATTALEGVMEALEAASPDDLSSVRVPAARLENVLKITPMYRDSLRELSSGIQAVPLRRFTTLPGDAADGDAGFGEPIAVTFAGERLSEVPTAGAALALFDPDGDGSFELARLIETADGPRLEIRTGVVSEPATRPEAPAADATGLLAADLWNDGGTDLVAFGAGGVTLWSGVAGEPAGQGGGIAPGSAEEAGLAGAAAVAATAFDYDLEADLDLVLAGPAGLGLHRNALDGGPDGPFTREGERVFPGIEMPEGVRALTWSDLDRDGDPDLLVAGDFGLRLLDNLRNGTFADGTEGSGLAGAGAVRAVGTGDLDNDGRPDLAAAGPDGLRVWWNRAAEGAGARFESGTADRLHAGALHAVIAFEADNDGRLDLAAAGPDGVVVLAHRDAGFEALPIEGGPGRPGGATALAATDIDGDGDLDLVAAGPEGLHRLTNEGGDANHWLSVRLRGLTQGNGKNNVHGVGATVEVIDGRARQLREHDGRVSHFGLGSREAADVLRVVWNNGVPQNRVGVAGDRTITEEQVLKGSCPFLYTWDGDGIGFVTDLLWGAPIGLPAAEGVWVPADASELVEVTGARSLPGRPGVYDLRVTEELWEAAYFDAVRLWVVDHPAEVAVASNLRIVPGVHPSEPPYSPDRVLGSRGVRPVAAARDGRGEDATARVAARDHVYADGYDAGLYQGLARRPWSFAFDLGAEPGDLAPDGGVRLLLDGWIFPTDASINIALSQRPALGLQAPRLEVAVPGPSGPEWRVLMPSMGHPAGKTKTMVVDTPPLPPGALELGVRLRIVTNQWISWDRIAWSPQPADDAPRVVARLAPERADLRFRGFSALVRRAPNAPHEYDYARTSKSSPWGASPGPYTRFGDVRELLAEPDSRPVVLGPGDEIALLFDASELPPPAPGHRRTLFLESHGWDKDYDKHTWAAEQGSLPLPFQGMTVYPWGDDVEPPDPAEAERFRREWLTRDEPGPDPGSGPGSGPGR